MKLSKLKLILPTLGDFANGVFAICICAFLFQVDLQWWHFVLAFLLALLPDIDAIPELVRNGAIGKDKESTNHRSYLHYPAVFIVVGLLVFKWSQFWGSVFLLAVSLHVLRDVLGTGWGVKLLWPVDIKNYKFFAHGNDTMQVTHVLTDTELKEEAENHSNSDWLEETYLRITWISGIEYTLFMVSLLLMAWHLVY